MKTARLITALILTAQLIGICFGAVPAARGVKDQPTLPAEPDPPPTFSLDGAGLLSPTGLGTRATGLTYHSRLKPNYSGSAMRFCAMSFSTIILEVHTVDKTLRLTLKDDTGLLVHTTTDAALDVSTLIPEDEFTSVIFSVDMETSRASAWIGDGPTATRIDFNLQTPNSGLLSDRQFGLISSSYFGEGEFTQYWRSALTLPEYSATPTIESPPDLGEYINAIWENGADGIGEPSKRIEANDLGERIERGTDSRWAYPAAPGPVIPDDLPTSTLEHEGTTFTFYGNVTVDYSSDGTPFVAVPEEGVFVTKSPEVTRTGGAVRNGWEFNPVAEGSRSHHGYDSRVNTYRDAKTAGDIIKCRPGDTVIAAVSATDPAIDTDKNGFRYGLIAPGGLSVLQFVDAIPAGLSTKIAGTPIKFPGRGPVELYDIDFAAKIAEHVTPNLVDTTSITDQSWKLSEADLEIIEKPQPLVGQATAANKGYECLMTFTWLSSVVPNTNNYGRGMAIAWNALIMNAFSTETPEPLRERIFRAWVKMGLDWNDPLLYSYPNGFGGNGAHHTFEQLPCYIMRLFTDKDTSGFFEEIQGTWSAITISQEMIDNDLVANTGEPSVTYPQAEKPVSLHSFVVQDIDEDGYIRADLSKLPGRMRVANNVRLTKVGTSIAADVTGAQPTDKTTDYDNHFGLVAINFGATIDGVFNPYQGTRLDVPGNPFAIGDELYFEPEVMPEAGDPWWVGTGSQNTLAVQGIVGWNPFRPMAYENDQHFAIHVAVMHAMQPLPSSMDAVRDYSLLVADGGVPGTNHTDGAAQAAFLQLVRDKLAPSP